VSCFGSTEVGFPIANREVGGELHPARSGPVPGHAVAGWLRRGYAARVVDADGADVEPGAIGELWIEPPDRRLILREYLDQPELTARSVVDGWCRTGDAVFQTDDGGFVFVDRMRDTIRRFGESISSAALEAAVCADPEVSECAAVGVPSPMTGQEILLLVLPPPGVTVDPAALAERLRGALPRYMNPRYIGVVDELPKTPTGKVRKAGLADGVDLASVWTASS
jgi:crotonobetaine/carnitine-CoA ligase